MLYLILAIASSAMVSVFMRISEGKVKHNIAMLVSNYLMCSILAGVFSGTGIRGILLPQLGITAALGTVNGGLYLGAFLLLQRNVRDNGVVLSTTFMKLGLLVTLAVSVFAYGEVPTLLQVLGTGIALTAILLINGRDTESGAGKDRLGLLWLLLCGGMADAMSKVFAESGVPGLESLFLLFTFATALIFCIACMLAKGQRLGKWELLFGLLVGVPNFFSSQLLLRALEELAAVMVYPVYSVGGILTVTVVGVLLFRERLTRRQWLALGLILAALVLLNL